MWSILNSPAIDGEKGHCGGLAQKLVEAATDAHFRQIREIAVTAAAAYPDTYQAPDANKPIGLWLLVCCAMVLAMIVIGGLTRLTGSGLSMVEWRPFLGLLPPFSEAEWQRVFALYQTSPEFREVNAGIDLAGFKSIFWLEYIHRLWGRLIGVVFLLPLLWFLVRRQVNRPLGLKLVGLFVLGGLQGLLGWYMVRSGLVDVPEVSQYRLVAHLGLALLIYALMLWTALRLLWPRPQTVPDRRLHRRATARLGDRGDGELSLCCQAALWRAPTQGGRTTPFR